MKVSFDGARKNLVDDFNNLFSELYNYFYSLDGYSDKIESIIEKMDNVATMVNAFLCMYDDNVEKDMNDLSEKYWAKKFNED